MKKILLSSILLLGVGGVSLAQERQAKAPARKKTEQTSKALLTAQKVDPAEAAAKQAAPAQMAYSDAIQRAVPVQAKAVKTSTATKKAN